MREILGKFISTLRPTGGMLPASAYTVPFPDRVPSSCDLIVRDCHVEFKGVGGIGAQGLCYVYLFPFTGQTLPTHGLDHAFRCNNAIEFNRVGPRTPLVQRSWRFPAGAELRLHLNNVGAITMLFTATVHGDLVPREDFCARIAA